MTELTQEILAELDMYASRDTVGDDDDLFLRIGLLLERQTILGRDISNEALDVAELPEHWLNETIPEREIVKIVERIIAMLTDRRFRTGALGALSSVGTPIAVPGLVDFVRHHKSDSSSWCNKDVWLLLGVLSFRASDEAIRAALSDLTVWVNGRDERVRSVFFRRFTRAHLERNPDWFDLVACCTTNSVKSSPEPEPPDMIRKRSRLRLPAWLRNGCWIRKSVGGGDYVKRGNQQWQLDSVEVENYFVRGNGDPVIFIHTMPYFDYEKVVSRKVADAFHRALDGSEPNLTNVADAAGSALQIPENEPSEDGSRCVPGFSFTAIWCRDVLHVFTIGSSLVLRITESEETDAIPPEGPPVPWGLKMVLPDIDFRDDIRTGTLRLAEGEQLLISPASSTPRPFRPAIAYDALFRRALAGLSAPYHQFPGAWLLVSRDS